MILHIYNTKIYKPLTGQILIYFVRNTAFYNKRFYYHVQVLWLVYYFLYCMYNPYIIALNNELEKSLTLNLQNLSLTHTEFIQEWSCWLWYKTRHSGQWSQSQNNTHTVIQHFTLACRINKYHRYAPWFSKMCDSCH